MNQVIGKIEKEGEGGNGEREREKKKERKKRNINVYNRAILFDYECILHCKMLLCTCQLIISYMYIHVHIKSWITINIVHRRQEYN